MSTGGDSARIVRLRSEYALLHGRVLQILERSPTACDGETQAPEIAALQDRENEIMTELRRLGDEP